MGLKINWAILIEGNYYRKNNRYIFKFSHYDGKNGACISDHYSINTSTQKYYDPTNSGKFNGIGSFYNATSEEILHLEECKKAGKYIEFKDVKFKIIHELWI